jgi:hypothetical protein
MHWLRGLSVVAQTVEIGVYLVEGSNPGRAVATLRK